MKKNQLASLALLGLASALVSTPVVATENIQETHFAAHGCGSHCNSNSGYRGQVAENAPAAKGLQNAAAKPQTLSVEEQEILNKKNHERSQQGQNHGCAGKKAQGASHGCAGSAGSAHGCGSR